MRFVFRQDLMLTSFLSSFSQLKRSVKEIQIAIVAVALTSLFSFSKQLLGFLGIIYKSKLNV